MNLLRQTLICGLILLSLIGCAPTGRYYQHHDSPPKVIPNNVTTKDAQVGFEPYAKANMRPYTIRGVRYQPLSTGKGFSDQGYASWYGQKFHGHLTANGETYDMYQMSAAHKTLPLPSFLRVTNLTNGNQVVVRVNDRGPFHAGRVVDLSYAAALKLDMLKTGVANVKIDIIHVSQAGEITVGKNTNIAKSNNKQKTPQVFIQVAALKNKQKINQIGHRLTSLYNSPYQAKRENNIYKLQLGPMKDETDANKLLIQLKASGYPSAYKVYSK
jgi:rare lipoprotein A